MRDLIEGRRLLMEDGSITVFGFVRGNALDFGRILKRFMPKRGAVTRMKKAQSGEYHVVGTTMFKLVGMEELINAATAAGQKGSNGMWTEAKRYMSFVPGFLENVSKE